MASSGNFAVLNSLIQSSTNTFSFGNCRITSSSGGWGAPLTLAANTGKFYVEVYFAVSDTNGGRISVLPTNSGKYNQGQQSASTSGDYAVEWKYDGDSNFIANNGSSSQSSVGSWSQGDVAAVAIDLDASPKTVQFYKNNSTIGTAENINTSAVGPFTVMIYAHNAGTWHINAGQDSTFGGALSAGGNADGNGFGDFKYSPPSGFNALCSANLPIDDNIDPAGDDGDTQHGAKHFGVVTFDGNGTTNAVTGLGFKPDLIWGFTRSHGQSKRLVDSSRGGSARLYSDNNSSEGTGTLTISAFGTDGFTSTGTAFNNDSGRTCGSWCWKANGGTTSTNTSGTITSTVQANTIAGFSIITYSGNGTSGATVGHGLGAVPAMTIIKQRNATNGWNVWHQGNNAGDVDSFGEINGSAAWYQNQGSNGPYTSAPTSTALTLTAYGQVNSGTGTYVGYIWSEIEGYSKFNKYTGNGNSDGPFIYTGFRPRLIFFKNTSGTSGWTVVDTETYPTNTTNGPERAEWNSSTAAVTGSSASREMEVLANGVKIRTSNSNVNTNGSTYIFGAWADVSFKYNNTHP